MNEFLSNPLGFIVILVALMSVIFTVIFGFFTQFLFRYLDAKIAPINEKLDNHITDTNKEIKELKSDVNDLKSSVKEINKKLDVLIERDK